METRFNPTAPILVTGGTGTLGPLVVAGLRGAGRAVRVMSRRGGAMDPIPGVEYVRGDLSTGDGIDAAVRGTEIVLHLAGSAKGDEVKARNLVESARRVGIRHVVYISVVGADRVPVESGVDRAMFGYFAAKRAAEQVIAESGLPWTTLRATQFHDLSLKTVEALAKLPIVPIFGGFRFQPIDARDVADRLVELALGEPAGLVPNLGGPKIYEMADLVRSYLRTVGKRRLIVPMPVPGAAARAFRDGANLAPDRAVGRRTWEAFLAERVGSAANNRLAAT